MNLLDFKVSTPIQIRMNDLDSFNHVNNGIQANYLDQGRTSYIEKITGQPVDWSTLDLVLVHVSLDFVEPILYSDTIACYTRVTSIGTKSIRLAQLIVDTKSKRIKTRSESVVVRIDRNSLETLPVSEEYRDKINQFEAQP